MAIGVIAALASGGGSSPGSTTTTAPPVAVPSQPPTSAGEPTVDKGLGARDASDDVKVTTCSPGRFDLPTVEVRVTNSSSTRSNYLIEVQLVTPSGDRAGSGAAFVNDLEPGQSTTERVLATTTGSPPSFVCRLQRVQRTAA
ncbi:MAG TPA: hypothetical protein VKP11_01490 [Frankiaceae bacterium]|nr:hypothetical protein [Frankiaceae bacterium]